MTIDIRLPRLGESIAEGTIVRWNKKPGERIERDEEFVLVSTDKIETALPCPYVGTLIEILAAPGETVRVGALIARLTPDGSTTAAPGASAGPQPPIAPASTQDSGHQVPTAPTPRPATGDTSESADDRNQRFRDGHDLKLFVSPVVRRLAREGDVDLSRVQGTGAHGRVTRRDIERVVAEGGAGSGFVAPEGGFQPGQAREAFVARGTLPFDAATAERYVATPGDGDRVEPLTGLGRAMAQHMAYTWWRSPHVSTLIEVDMRRVSEHRKAAGARFEKETGRKLSFTSYVARAVAGTLARHPNFCASLTADFRRITPSHVGLGVAVARPDGGLVVPVVPMAETLSLRGMALALEERVEKARSGRLSGADLRGGNFTITNVGSNGNLASWPLINQPQCAILATGAVQKRAVVHTDTEGADSITIRPMMYITLTYDHRVNDGAASGRFLADLRRTLEGWAEPA